MRGLESALSSRAAIEVTLPAFAESDEVPQEVTELLKAPLTVDGAVKVALTHNRAAREALATLGIARGEAVQQSVLPNPTIEVGLRAPGGPQPMQLDLGVDLNLSGLWLAGLRGGVAEAELEAAKLKAAGALLTLVYETKLAFYGAQAAQQRYQLRLHALEAQQASYAAAQELARVGNLHALRLAEELAAVELSRARAAEAEVEQLDAREALTRKLGLFGRHVAWTLDGALPQPPQAPDEPDAENKAIAASLELQELSHRALAASRRVGVAKTQGLLPQLTAGFHGERDAEFWELGAHVAFALPMFDRAQGTALAAQAEFELMEARAQAHAVALRSAVRTWRNRLESAGARERHYTRRLLPAREEALKQTVLQYNAMEVGVFEVLASQRAVTETALDRVDAALKAWQAQAALELIYAGKAAEP